jgi:hypothetical protein
MGGVPRKDPNARREYNRAYQRIWYRKNRELHMQRVLRVTRRQRESARQYVDNAKSRPCMDCGVQYPPCAMDFDHVRGTKLADLAKLRLARGGCSKLVDEIAKCEVVCAVCHRLRTKLRREGGEVKPSEVVQRIGPNYTSVLVYA